MKREILIASLAAAYFLAAEPLTANAGETAPAANKDKAGCKAGCKSKDKAGCKSKGSEKPSGQETK